MLKIGDVAPDFTLFNQDGHPISLHDYRGEWVVLYFYPKDDTPGCTVEACQFRDSSALFQKQGITVLGISKDSPESHRKFADKYHLNFTLLADPSHSVIEQYGAWQEKSLYGKKYMGTKRMTLIIDPDGVIRHLFPSVTPKGHEQEVLARVQKLRSS